MAVHRLQTTQKRNKLQYTESSLETACAAQMGRSSQCTVNVGRGKSPSSRQYSKNTQDLLRSMMQELTLTNRQRKHISECLKNGSALPLTTQPPSSVSPRQPKGSKCVHKLLPGRPQRRSAASCLSGNNVRERFCPAPTRDLEKEKRRLQSILATGQEESADDAPSKNVATCVKAAVTEERDRYQEVLDEIEERRQFLADMASLGQEKQYIHIINTEISQKIRELEILDEAQQPNKEVMASERPVDPR
ncbi:UPF0193 protein EVG1 [Dunckerocampus dactyliophorus]|uniref:UPF0193 protein EVG1 n=1 Tax=Dunckerocampus dactyliophorus TaxID=161453 RepID=UPI00240768AA|nr:UPF0193 protein EVG1 [Dunckerocampus dactyliophorus]XP_054634719.1 UPF0193 protein EVG1 [Dunckerocampus dactyliophorus]